MAAFAKSWRQGFSVSTTSQSALVAAI